MGNLDNHQDLELHPANLGSSITNITAAETPSPNRAIASSGTSSSAKVASKSSGPIPMSMPSILRTPGLSHQSNNHLSHLLDRSRGPSSSSSSSSYSFLPTQSRRVPTRSSASSSSSKEPGRRKQRRAENSKLLSNPHAVRPTIKDYRLHSNEIKSTFPSTITTKHNTRGKGGKVQSVPVPSCSKVGYSEPEYNAVSAAHGHFGKSLKDAQRVLKRLEVGGINDDMIKEGKAGDLERFIWLVDKEIRTWSKHDVYVFNSNTNHDHHHYNNSNGDRKFGRILLDKEFNFTTITCTTSTTTTSTTTLESGINDSIPIVDLNAITPNTIPAQLVEFQRTPNALVWLVHDPFLRLVVHCLARVSKCPSFSKDDLSRPGLRFTWILNRNPLARRSRKGRRVSVSSSIMSIDNDHDAVVVERSDEGRAQIRVMHLAAAAAASRGGGGMGLLETPPTTDFDSHTELESELDVLETETESEADDDATSSSGGSNVMVSRQLSTTQTRTRGGGDESIDVATDDGVEAEAEVELDEMNLLVQESNMEGADEEVVDTDEEEAEILRRVRRWAIESHKQRAASAAAAAAKSTSNERNQTTPTKTTRNTKLNVSTRFTDLQEKQLNPDATLITTPIAEEQREESE
ncbi:uncharacterized protein MEPE_03206 [Melanopsichium pennsylvanicum]|uniref:Uncharacterized protein n=1 Tax=Melanopsichium pennsylvanicum TaxID=63383 RepID=A0AAJ5C594_9BASI|nr:uncharacterized protein MEPE_03206 [Melanopsichium pennsylvanicum]